VESGPLEKPVITEYPAESIIHYFEPSRVGQVRGLPCCYAVLADMIDLHELQSLEMLAAKDHSRVSKVVKTPSGEVNTDETLTSRFNSSPTASAPDAKVYYEEVIGAETIAMRPGDELQLLQSQRPSVAVQQFWDYVTDKVCAGLGLPTQIVIPESLQGTMTRASLDMAAGWFRCRSSALAEVCAQVWEHVISLQIPANRLPQDWRSIRWTAPRAINVDVGYNSAATIADLNAGLTDFDSVYSAQGLDWQLQFDKLKEQQDYAKAIGLTLGETKQPQPAKP
jgi:capsid protein